MRPRLAAYGALAGFGALLALARRRRGAPAEAAADPRAEALRRKLDEARSAESDAGPSAADASVEARRRAVHERGRAAADEMRKET